MIRESLDSFVDDAIQQLVPNAKFNNRGCLDGGRSGAAVVKVEIYDVPSGGISNGEYILKLQKHSVGNNSEARGHKLAYDWNSKFSMEHIPELVASDDLHDDGLSAMLFKIAGSSIDDYITAGDPRSDNFVNLCQSIVKDTLLYWINVSGGVEMSPHELLETWSGYRLDPLSAGAFHAFVEQWVGTQIGVFGPGEGILNPLKFYEFAKQRNWPKRLWLTGLLHRDLHGGNILVHRSPRQKKYWIIDFGLSKQGPAGYDQAYLEVANILSYASLTRDKDPLWLMRLLRYIDRSEQLAVPRSLGWLKACLEGTRTALSEWRDSEDNMQWSDTINRQFYLARVAAGINWAKKELDDEYQKYLALCYAGWAARQYLERFEQDIWGELAIPSGVAHSSDEGLWEIFWQITEGFSPAARRFLLVAETLNNQAPLRAIGQIEWSAVIDLDPYSDQSGLYQYASPALKSRRFVEPFNVEIPSSNFDSATAWMMASGYITKDEEPTDFRTWSRKKLRTIHSLLKALKENNLKEKPLCVIVLPGRSSDADPTERRLIRVIQAIDEEISDQDSILILGNDVRTEIPHKSVPLTVDAFLQRIERTFGTYTQREAAAIPGDQGQWPIIPIEALRIMQGNFKVLHSSILNESVDPEEDRPQDTFWRGRPPTWADFYAGLDIKREIHGKLIDEIRKQLEKSGNHTVVLCHTPGAGGTTAAWRVAWDLHREYPTVILSNLSSSLSAQLKTLYDIAQRPILLVADGADLPETIREDVHRALSRKNVPVVMLYLRHVFPSPDESASRRQRHSGDKSVFYLYEPMGKTEAQHFCDIYTSLASEPKRIKELKKITTNRAYARYRSPFFYGLITFERDFLPVKKYVEEHLRGVRDNVRTILEYLALVTIYANVGLPETLLKQLLGYDADSPLDILGLLGEGPAHLVNSRFGYVRFMHQILAEDLLGVYYGDGKWRSILSDLSVRFISAIVAVLGADSLWARQLFRQLFVNRIETDLDDVDDIEDMDDGRSENAKPKQYFSPLIEEMDSIFASEGHLVFRTLTDACKDEPHFWNHFGRHYIYKLQYDEEEAEICLQRAIDLAPNDYIHYHTLGVVLYKLIMLQLQAPGQKERSVSERLESITNYFERAVEAFKYSRVLNPENNYGYVTHIQMILKVVGDLKRQARAASIYELREEGEDVLGWVKEQMAIAYQLLTEAKTLYGTLDQQSAYVRDCELRWYIVYGDSSEAIRLGELDEAAGLSTSESRLALVAAYRARHKEDWGDDRWNGMPQAVLQRIVALMERNLRSHPAGSSTDCYFWFQAYKHLSNFDVNDALAKLSLWASLFPSWRPHYYMYALHFYLWFSGRSVSVTEMEKQLKLCRGQLIGKDSFSYLWFGKGPKWFPLESHEDLGPWDWGSSDPFWKDVSLLSRVNGGINPDTIRILSEDKLSGFARIDNRVDAFFRAPSEFYTQKEVSFYLGLSPIGLQAWKLIPGHDAGINRFSLDQQQHSSTPVYQDVPSQGIPQQVKDQQLKKLQKEQVVKFIADMTRLKSELGVHLPQSELEVCLKAVFGSDQLLDDLGGLEALLSEAGTTQMADSKESSVTRRTKENLGLPLQERTLGQVKYFDAFTGRGYVSVLGELSRDRRFRTEDVLMEDRGRVSKWAIVEFTPDADSHGIPVARDIRLLDDMITLTEQGLIQQQDLRNEVARAILEILEEAEFTGKTVLLQDLSQQLQQRFRGEKPLAVRLDMSLPMFVGSIDGVSLTDAKNPVVERRDVLAFGRLPSTTVWSMTGIISDTAQNDLLEMAKKLILKWIQEAAEQEEDIEIGQLANRLAHSLPGQGQIARRLGYNTFSQVLNNIPEIEVYEKKGSKYIRSRS